MVSIFIDPSKLDPNWGGSIQLIFLLLVYGFILSKSSALISDGSELLLLIPALAGIVGSVVLPVLGAVPDGAIVLFSGFGPDAQNQLNVGVGALAGSTIMLLTIPWALCILFGRVDIVNGEANYKGKPRLTRGFTFFGTGVTPRPSISKNGIIMILTALSYLIIQGSAFGARCDLSVSKDCKGTDEHWWSLGALIVCILAFAAYMFYNVRHANDEDSADFIAEVRKQAVESHVLSLSAAFERDLLSPSVDASSLLHEDPEKRFTETLKNFFHKYDRNGDNVIDPFELKFLLKDIGEEMSPSKFDAFLKEIDTDGSGSISFKEFSVAMKQFLSRKLDHTRRIENELSVQKGLKVTTAEAGAEEAPEDDSDEEEEEVPEDLAHLDIKQQRLRILLRAGWMMGVGTAVVLLFSDPMVSVLNELGVRSNIEPFYVAFVLAPIASNASELIASINSARKKTKKTITISLAALEGAACMNNTFCLGIFLCLIFFKGLVWEFSAETIAIVSVELILFGFAMKKTHRIFEASLILSLYPLSIFFVWFLENVAGLN